MKGRERFLAALQGRAVDRPPVWIMRQAGRYLPEYRAVRDRYPMEEVLKRGDLASEITLQPIRRFGMDAAVIMSDILVPLEGMGRKVAFAPGGPRVDPILLPSQVDNLAIPDPEERFPFVLDTVRRVREAIPDTAVLGFAGAPFTLAAYMLEGGASREFAATKRFMYHEPEAFQRLLAACADTVVAHLEAQAEAGADAVQLFDTWAETLPASEYADVCLPHVRSIVRRLRGKVPVILFARGTAHLLPALVESGADALSVDWRVGLEETAKRLPRRLALQGNLDPTLLLAPIKRVEEETRRVIEDGRRVPGGHVVNLGHGVLPSTPIEAVEALVKTVKAAR